MLCDICLFEEGLESEMVGDYPVHLCGICNREFHQIAGYRPKGGVPGKTHRKGCTKCSSDSAMFIEARIGDTLRYRCPNRHCGSVVEVIPEAPIPII